METKKALLSLIALSVLALGSTVRANESCDHERQSTRPTRSVDTETDPLNKGYGIGPKNSEINSSGGTDNTPPSSNGSLNRYNGTGSRGDNINTSQGSDNTPPAD